MDKFLHSKVFNSCTRGYEAAKVIHTVEFQGQKVSQEIAIEFKDSDPLEKLVARSRLFEPICS